MAVESDRTVLRSFRTLLDDGTLVGLTDGQLLERFATRPASSAEAAFEALLERHGPMVLRVCRGILTDPNDAQDAFQSTFLVMIKKARSLWVRDSLGPWLHQVAYRTACCARADTARRRRLERQRADHTVATEPALSHESHGLIHEEINRLPAHFRATVILCDLQGCSHEHAAKHLNCAVGTVKSRLARARARLRTCLLSRGLAPAAITSLGLHLSSPSATALMAKEPTARALLQLVLTESPIPSRILILSNEVLRMMFMSKLRIAAAITLTAGLITCGSFLLLRQTPTQAAPPEPQAKPATKPETAAAIPFERVGLTADDLVQSLSLDIYKFRVNIPKGQRFSLVFRAQHSETSPARTLAAGIPYTVGSDEPTTICVSFIRQDRQADGFLLSDAPLAFYRVFLSGGTDGGFATIVENPFGKLSVDHRIVIAHRNQKSALEFGQKDKEISLITAESPNPKPAKGAPTHGGYPRAEVVIIPAP